METYARFFPQTVPWLTKVILPVVLTLAGAWASVRLLRFLVLGLWLGRRAG